MFLLKVLRRRQYGCKFLGDAGLQGRGENHVELKRELLQY